ncbi:MAG TPA: RidA family protein [Aestuariivirgaceae bacterium]|nr:RidA family protein [Aestuariivirgaceae bacterium]
MTIKRHVVMGVSSQGSPYSVLVSDGAYAFMAGVVASDLEGGAAAHGDIGAETRLVMEAIRRGLQSIGLGMDRIVRVDVHLTDLATMAVMNQAYRKFFDGDKLPARTCTQSTQLAGGSNVEITVTARLSPS